MEDYERRELVIGIILKELTISIFMYLHANIFVVISLFVSHSSFEKGVWTIGQYPEFLTKLS
jgi:hypothetical protein